MSAEKRHSTSSEDDRREETRNKRVKINHPLSSYQENIAGYVEKVYLKNFMCHSSLEVSLNKRINFIVGRNGSGKSAILAGVVIALGCKASSTNRASTIKEFVKSGASAATVQVTLCNQGFNAYKQEVYGSKIIVVRKIFSNSGHSSYTFKSAKGEVISTKREELDKIIIAFNIQVDNPISVLNQDTARTFLALSDPKSKYSFFLKATKLEDVDQIHAKSLNCETSATNRMKLRKESMKCQQNEIEELEKKAKALEKLDEIRNRSVNLEKEYYWALARDEETLLLELKRKMEEERKNGSSLENHLGKCKEDLEKKIVSMREVTAQLDDKSKEMKERNQSLQTSNNLFQDANKLYRDHLLMYKQLKKECKAYELEIQGVHQEIEKHKGGQERIEEKKRLTEAIEALKLEEKKTAATQRTTEEGYEKLTDQFYRFREQASVLQGEKRTIEQSVGELSDKLKTLQTHTNNLALYGRWMPRLVQRIEECHAQGLFVRKPLGPLGVMLKVVDPEWAYAIQSELGGILKTFACHCSKDSRILQTLFREVVDSPKKPGILVSKFTDKLFDIEKNSVKVPGYMNLFDALQFSDVNVANVMIDNKNIETILLIPTNQEAAMMMSKNAPKNCKRSITKKADLYFPYPDYRTYTADQKQHVSLLQVSRQEAISQLKVQLKAKQNYLQEKELEVMELNNNIKKSKDEMERAVRRIKDLKIKKSEVGEKIRNHEAAMEKLPDPQHFLMLNSELQNLQEKVKSVVEKLSKADQESDGLRNKFILAADDVKRIQAEIKEIDESMQNLQMEVANQKEIVRRAESKVKDSEVFISEHTIKVNEMVELLQKKEKQTEEAVKSACSLCPVRISSKRAANDIKREITDAKTYQSMVEEETGVTANVSDILKEKKRKYQENVDNLNLIRSGFQILSQSLKDRNDLYLVIKKLMDLKVSYVFRPLLFNRGYKGDMNFDHVAKTLQVSVFPKQEDGKRETKSLSGGERSYSTISFILALWNCVEPPFYFMDEFDVFMDKVNRKIVIEMLLTQARENKKHQYVFLTPQDTSSVYASEDITIHKLDDPERGTELTQRS